MQNNLPVGVPLNLPPATVNDAIAEFEPHRALKVRQKRRWLELLLNWESKNSYAVFDEEGNHTLQVKEEGNGLLNVLKRLVLRTARPFDVTVYDNPIPKPLLRMHRPFRFFFHRLEVSAADGTLIGAIQREWSWLRRIYTVEDSQGQKLAQLFGPIFSPWTFKIMVNEAEQGMLQKRWSGLFKEALSDADNFVLELTHVSDPRLKLLCFSATVLIDVVHFEQSKHN